MSTPVLTPEQVARFDTDGYLVIPNFFSPTQTSTLLTQAHHLLDTFSLEDHPMTRFTTKESESSKHVGDTYFLDSGSDIRYFFEEGAIGEDGQSSSHDSGASSPRRASDLPWMAPFVGSIRQAARQLHEADEHQQDWPRTTLPRSSLSGLYAEKRRAQAGGEGSGRA